MQTTFLYLLSVPFIFLLLTECSKQATTLLLSLAIPDKVQSCQYYEVISKPSCCFGVYREPNGRVQQTKMHFVPLWGKNERNVYKRTS